MKVPQSCPTLWDPMDYAVHGILQARILERVAFPFSRGSSQPRNRTQVSRIAGMLFTSWATWGGIICRQTGLPETSYLDQKRTFASLYVFSLSITLFFPIILSYCPLKLAFKLCGLVKENAQYMHKTVKPKWVNEVFWAHLFIHSPMHHKGHLWWLTVLDTIPFAGDENWIIKKAECWSIGAFELWSWRRLLPGEENGNLLQDSCLENPMDRGLVGYSPKGSQRVRHNWATKQQKTLENPSDSKEIRPVNSKWNQPWIFTGRTDIEVEAPVVWPPDPKSWLIGKDPDAGKNWEQEEKGATEDKMVGWHHQLNGHESKQTPGDSEGQGTLACCSPWGC